LIHEPTKTSEESANIRGATLASGAKAMLLKDGKTGLYLLAIISAARKLSWKKIRSLIGSKKLNLATE
jgi:Ala-tRNA(Pro) deacylase